MEKTVSKIIPESEISWHNPKYQPNLPAAEPVSILELASYQDGAIVSRTLSNAKNGTITLFAFDQGQRLSEHTSPFDAFVQILEGTAEITVSGVQFRANEGEIMILPANQSHALNALSKFKMILIMIRAK